MNCKNCGHELKIMGEGGLKLLMHKCFNSPCASNVCACGCRNPEIEKKTLEDWLDEFKVEMLKKFQEHDDKWRELSVTRPDYDFETQLATEEYLRKDKIYHFAKWIYKSVEHNHMPETDTIVNETNMNFLLWIKLKLKETELNKTREDVK